MTKGIIGEGGCELWNMFSNVQICNSIFTSPMLAFAVFWKQGTINVLETIFFFCLVFAKKTQKYPTFKKIA